MSWVLLERTSYQTSEMKLSVSAVSFNSSFLLLSYQKWSTGHGEAKQPSFENLNFPVFLAHAASLFSG